jgi:hypothetical protein
MSEGTDPKGSGHALGGTSALTNRGGSAADLMHQVAADYRAEGVLLDRSRAYLLLFEQGHWWVVTEQGKPLGFLGATSPSGRRRTS